MEQYRNEEVMYLGANDQGNIFALKGNHVWSYYVDTHEGKGVGFKGISCECCIPDHIKRRLDAIGITRGGIPGKPPTDEEWQEVLMHNPWAVSEDDRESLLITRDEVEKRKNVDS